MNPNIRGSRAKRRSRRLARRDLGWMIALGVAVPVLVTGYYLASSAARSAAPAADVGNVLTGKIQAGATAPAAPAAGGWGEGGYPMVAGSAAGEPGSAAGDPGSSGSEAGSSGSEAGSSGSEAGNVPGAGPAAVTNVASANWAGYAATGAAGSFTSVSASWAQPAVTCGAASTFSSFWVGLDGDGTPTVEQTGTEADCAHGAASYQGWYEIFPNAPVFFPNPVQPGDAMSASVVSSGGTFTLTLSDATQGWTQTTQQAEAAARLGSAEVIAEAPSNGTVLPLADFGTVDFTGATVGGAPIGDSANLTELTMESAGGAALATPSALADGSAFSVTADTGASAAGGPSPGSAVPVPGTDPAGLGSLGSGGGGGGASDGGGRRHHHHVLGS